MIARLKGHFMRLLKLVVILLVLILAALAGYAYFGDMSSDPREMRMPVELDLGVATTEPGSDAGTSDTATPDSTAPDSTTESPQDGTQDSAAPEQGAATGQDDFE